MDPSEARALIEGALPPGTAGGTWADLGAGTGTFTLALATLLGPSGKVIAVDRDPASVVALRQTVERRRANDGAQIIVQLADFAEPFELPELDGALLANALHFVPPDEQLAVLRGIVPSLKPAGRIVLVEYEGRRANQWVPHPIPFSRFRTLARQARLSAPVQLGSKSSIYGGALYAAYAER